MVYNKVGLTFVCQNAVERHASQTNHILMLKKKVVLVVHRMNVRMCVVLVRMCNVHVLMTNNFFVCKCSEFTKSKLIDAIVLPESNNAP